MKQLIIPVPTPGDIPSESALQQLDSQTLTGDIICHGAQGTTYTRHVIHGVPQECNDTYRALLATFKQAASGILACGPTGAGSVFGPLQYWAILRAIRDACPENITIYAGLLGGDTMVGKQAQIAQGLGITHLVLGLNHTGNNPDRFRAVMERLDPASRLILCNLQTFFPAKKAFIRSCLEQDARVVGFIDSSGKPEYFSWLLSLRDHHPGFRVFHGNEEGYGGLSPVDLGRTGGLVSDDANVHPGLLEAFMNNTTHTTICAARSTLHDDVDRLSGRPANGATEGIERHMHAIMLRLAQIPIHPDTPHAKIFHPHQTRLHVSRIGGLFDTYIPT